jgi:hypothetical protein
MSAIRQHRRAVFAGADDLRINNLKRGCHGRLPRNSRDGMRRSFAQHNDVFKIQSAGLRWSEN